MHEKYAEHVNCATVTGVCPECGEPYEQPAHLPQRCDCGWEHDGFIGDRVPEPSPEAEVEAVDGDLSALSFKELKAVAVGLGLVVKPGTSTGSLLEMVTAAQASAAGGDAE